MSEELPPKMKSHLAVAMAQGFSVKKWARANQVPERTAYRWAKEPKVRTAVEGWRRRALDRAVGRMAKRATWAADQIADLGATAESESVKLAALRSVLSDMMKVAQFSVLEARMVEVEELLRVRDGAAPCSH